MLKWRDGNATNFDGTAKPTYAGAVLAINNTREARIMSDVWGTETYATVLDGDKITTVTTAMSEYSLGYRIYADADVDATFAARTAARAYKVKLAADAAKARYDAEAERVADDAKKIAKGKDAIVARGRKVAKGTTGTIFWLGYGKFGLRAGIKDAAGTVYWTAASNLDILNPDDYILEFPVRPSDADLLAKAEAMVEPIAA